MLLEGPRGETFKNKQYDIPRELEEELQAERKKKREEASACHMKCKQV
jgi:hypothetical protein